MAETSPKKAIIVIVALLLFMGAGVLFLRGTTPPGVETDARLSDLQAAISEYVAKNGAPPETLAALPDAKTFVDTWNNPLTYRVLDDGRIEIGSLGGDGKPGGHVFKADKMITFRP